MYKKIVLMFIMLVFCAQVAQAEDIAVKIQNQYEKLSAFSADFTQELTNAASKQTQVRKGDIMFKQPQFIRWETKTPEPELLIVGDQTVWNYIPDEELALKFKFSQVFTSKTMLRFLSGKANIREDFMLKDQGDDNGYTKLRLIPKEPEPGLVLAYLWVDHESNMLRKVLVVDFYGNGNQVELENLKLNPELEDGLFQFTPPEGVEVEDNTIEKMIAPPQ